MLKQGKLLWRGKLAAEPTPVDVTYTAVGKGLYELAVAPGGILDHYQVSLIAKGSDVRMLELSLQPTSLERSGGSSTYRWEYERLLFGRPVRVDVLGIAPIDRLGELTWLGPISVIVFGILVGLVVQAAAVRRFDIWVLLLTVGTFAGAYPLMYFAQEYISLGPAVVASAAVAVLIIAIRAATLMGVWRGLAGVALPAAVIMCLTLVAAIWTPMQGVLLTIEALGFFIAAMMLMPKVNAASTGFWGVGLGPATNVARVHPGGTSGIATRPDRPADADVDREADQGEDADEESYGINARAISASASSRMILRVGSHAHASLGMATGLSESTRARVGLVPRPTLRPSPAPCGTGFASSQSHRFTKAW